MRLANTIRYTLVGFFSRTTISLTYWLITVLICIQVMIRGSLLVGASALVGCALCYWGASAYMGSLLARRETRIGVLAVILIVAGQALMIWSGFMVRLFDIEIGGAFWALIGAASAIVVRVWDWMKLRPHTQPLRPFEIAFRQLSKRPQEGTFAYRPQPEGVRAPMTTSGE